MIGSKNILVTKMNKGFWKWLKDGAVNIVRSEDLVLIRGMLYLMFGVTIAISGLCGIITLQVLTIVIAIPFLIFGVLLALYGVYNLFEG